MKKHIFKLSLIFLLTALAAGLAIFMLIRKINFSAFNINALHIVFLCLAVIAGALIDVFIHMFFHETGHLIFGKFNGFKIYSLRIWFISLEKRSDRKGFKIKFSSSKYGGVSQMIPMSGQNLYKKFGLYVLGGLAGSFTIAMGFLLILLLVNFSTFAAMYIYATLLAGFPLSVYFFFLNAIPFSAGGLSNDGGIIRGLLKKDSETKIYINVLTIQSKLCAGLSPLEIDEKLYFDVPVVADNCISKILLLNLKYNYFLDKLDFESSGQTMRQLEALERYMPDIYLEQILVGKFFNAVFYLKDCVWGEMIYSRIKSSIEMNDSICSLRIRMAYELFIKNNADLAIETGKAALKLKDSYPLKGLAKMEEKLINFLIELSKENKKTIEQM